MTTGFQRCAVGVQILQTRRDKWYLAVNFNESINVHGADVGLRGPDEVMELWENADGDWTLIITYAGGKRCIVAMGKALSPIAVLPHS